MSEQDLTFGRRKAISTLGSGIIGGISGCLGGNNRNETETRTTQTWTATARPTLTPTQTDGSSEPTPTGHESNTPSNASPEPPTLKARPEYLDWTFGTDLVERQSFTIWRHDPAVVDEYEDRLNQTARQLMNRREGFAYAATGVSWSGLNEFIRSRRVWVLLGDIIEHRLVDKNVTNGPYERKPPEYNGYLLYVHPDEPKAIAAKDEIVMLTDRPFDDHEPETVLKGVIDTGRGEHTRLEEQRPLIQDVARCTGGNTITDIVDWSAESEPPQPGLEVGGVDYSFKENGARAISVLQFESEDAAQETSYETVVDNIITFQESWTNTHSWYDGRRIITEGKVSYDKIFV